MIRGNVTREQTVWCWVGLNWDSPESKLVYRHHEPGYGCEHHHQEAGPVTDVARQSGWTRHPKYAWTCPRCSAAIKKITAEEWAAINVKEEGR